MIQGASGPDVIFGHDGDETIQGGEGTDSILGNDGNDVLFGDSGTNVIFGAGGNSLFGGSDNDVFNGGLGKDFLIVTKVLILYLTLTRAKEILPTLIAKFYNECNETRTKLCVSTPFLIFSKYSNSSYCRL